MGKESDKLRYHSGEVGLGGRSDVGSEGSRGVLGAGMEGREEQPRRSSSASGRAMVEGWDCKGVVSSALTMVSLGWQAGVGRVHQGRDI